MRFLYPIGGAVDCYGIITAPNHRGIPDGIKAGLPWAADIGCLDGPSFVKRADFEKTFQWLRDVMLPYRDKCIFVTVPDVVGDSEETLAAYGEFTRYFTVGGNSWPLAYVAQNGSESLPIPEDAAAVFIGGVQMDGETYRSAKDYSGQHKQLDWKESMRAVDVIKRGQEMGKHIHIGRVNWKRKYDIFNVLEGSEHFTCDGTRTRYGRDKALQDWKAYEAQRPLVQL